MKTPQFAHQKIGTAALVKNAAFALFDEPGAGKSKQCVDAACILLEAKRIDTVVVIAPHQCCCVWRDPLIGIDPNGKEIAGEIYKHSWIPASVWESHRKFKRVWETGTTGLTWIISNYEFLRSGERLQELCARLENRKVLLICDESSYVKNRTALQSKAISKLRKLCVRCIILNGTPLTEGPLDLWSQFNILDPAILEKRYKNFYHFRSEYCEMRTMQMGLRRFPVVKAYRRLDKLAKILAPYVLRREKKDCLDLPPKLYTEREVALSPESWKRYQELKRECVVSLGNGDQRLEPNAAVRLMRLAQLTSGILGGNYVETDGDFVNECETRDLSDEKLNWCVQYLTEECTAKAVIVWTRWRRERERLVKALDSINNATKYRVWQLYGGQPQRDRDGAVSAFTFVGSRSDLERGILIAQPHAGGHGLNLVAASEAIYLSNDFALGIRLQSEDRMHRPGQFNPCTYIDVLATGPKGERTIDHIIFKALREKKSVADLTCNEWRKELSDE